jgi:sialate O-acetylesterase
MSQEIVGAIIEAGAVDWQIFQQDEHGHGNISLRGTWKSEQPGHVEARLVHQDTGVAVTAALDWKPVTTSADRKWSAELRQIPAGGLYRLETRYWPDSQPAGEWSVRGDMRHFLGVGDLWVIAGQSNSAGYGRGPYHDAAELGIHLFRNSEQWALATHPMNESTDIRHMANFEGANPGHSPYLHFGRLLKNALNHPIGLIQTALGGSPLKRWNPANVKEADLYENMVHCVEKVGGRIRGILWYQGESDCAPEELAKAYADSFCSSVRTWRERLHQPNLPVITVQLNRVFGKMELAGERLWSIVREGQRQVPKRLANVAVVPTFDLPLSDLVHNSPAGNLLLGERMARAALGMVHGKAEDYLAPDLQSVKRLPDGKTLELTFAPVSSRIDTVDVLAVPFSVEDADGWVPVEKTSFPGKAIVRLELGRALSGKAVVHAGFGRSPDAMPMDMERFIPILGFYNVEIT